MAHNTQDWFVIGKNEREIYTAWKHKILSQDQCDSNKNEQREAKKKTTEKKIIIIKRWQINVRTLLSDFDSEWFWFSCKKIFRF